MRKIKCTINPIGLLCIYWFITQQMEKYDKIVIENGKAYRYKMIKLSNQFTCTYLAYLTDNRLLMERLKNYFLIQVFRLIQIVA